MSLFTPAELQRCLCLRAVGGRALGGSGSIHLDLARDSWVGSAPAPEPGAAVTRQPLPLVGPPGLPLGIWQTVAQPARQHLRLSAHSPSERHSCVQFRSTSSAGHTPDFSAPVPGRRTGSGGLSPALRGHPPPV